MDLTIDYNREFIHRIVGSVTGNGGTGTQLLEAGPVTISGTTDFASTRYLTSEVESLTDATLDSLAINATMDNGTIDVSIDSVADVTLTGQLAVVSVTPTEVTTPGTPHSRWAMSPSPPAPPQPTSDSPA